MQRLALSLSALSTALLLSSCLFSSEQTAEDSFVQDLNRQDYGAVDSLDLTDWKMQTAQSAPASRWLWIGTGNAYFGHQKLGSLDFRRTSVWRFESTDTAATLFQNDAKVRMVFDSINPAGTEKMACQWIWKTHSFGTVGALTESEKDSLSAYGSNDSLYLAQLNAGQSWDSAQVELPNVQPGVRFELDFPDSLSAQLLQLRPKAHYTDLGLRCNNSAAFVIVGGTDTSRTPKVYAGTQSKNLYRNTRQMSLESPDLGKAWGSIQTADTLNLAFSVAELRQALGSNSKFSSKNGALVHNAWLSLTGLQPLAVQAGSKVLLKSLYRFDSTAYENKGEYVINQIDSSVIVQPGATSFKVRIPEALRRATLQEGRLDTIHVRVVLESVRDTSGTNLPLGLAWWTGLDQAKAQLKMIYSPLQAPLEGIEK
jgi:hypothetical protein